MFIECTHCGDGEKNERQVMSNLNWKTVTIFGIWELPVLL